MWILSSIRRRNQILPRKNRIIKTMKQVSRRTIILRITAMLKTIMEMTLVLRSMKMIKTKMTMKMTT